MKILSKTCAGLLGLSLILPAAYGGTHDMQKEEAKQEEQAKGSQSQSPAGKSVQASKDLKQVQGTVIQHKFVNLFKDKKEMESAQKSGKAENKVLVVLLKTEKGNDRLVVDLGQMKEAPKIKDGETKLQVEGKLINVGTEQLFVAKRAKLDGNNLNVQRQST